GSGSRRLRRRTRLGHVARGMQNESRTSTMPAMLQRLFGMALTALAITGCVTGATLARGPGRVTGPMLAGAVAADLLLTAAAAYQIQDLSAEASVATAPTAS